MTLTMEQVDALPVNTIVQVQDYPTMLYVRRANLCWIGFDFAKKRWSLGDGSEAVLTTRGMFGGDLDLDPGVSVYTGAAIPELESSETKE